MLSYCFIYIYIYIYITFYFYQLCNSCPKTLYIYIYRQREREKLIIRKNNTAGCRFLTKVLKSKKAFEILGVANYNRSKNVQCWQHCFPATITFRCCLSSLLVYPRSTGWFFLLGLSVLFDSSYSYRLVRFCF